MLGWACLAYSGILVLSCALTMAFHPIPPRWTWIDYPAVLKPPIPAKNKAVTPATSAINRLAIRYLTAQRLTKQRLKVQQ